MKYFGCERKYFMFMFVFLCTIISGYLVVDGLLTFMERYNIATPHTEKTKSKQCEDRGGIYLSQEQVCLRGERIILDNEK